MLITLPSYLTICRCCVICDPRIWFRVFQLCKASLFLATFISSLSLSLSPSPLSLLLFLTFIKGMLDIFRCMVLLSSQHAFQDTIFSLADPRHGCHQLWSDYLAGSHWIWKGLVTEWPIFLFRYPRFWNVCLLNIHAYLKHILANCMTVVHN